MLILLPPSRSVSSVRRGRPVELEHLSFPELTTARRTVLDALVTISHDDDAVTRLGEPAGVADQVRRNARLHSAPAVAVRHLYTGVLYDALGLGALPPHARRRAASSVVVISALWGALRPGDRVPPYRLSMGAALPGVGSLGPWWRPRLEQALDGVDGVLVDCRSAEYRVAFHPSPHQADRTVSVRVLDRGRVVSHSAKHGRGLLARHLLTRGGRTPASPEQVAQAAGEGFDVALHPPARRGAGWTLDVETG